MLAERAKEWTEQWFAEGRETGLQEGLAQGRVQGLEQGRVRGLEQGRAQGLERGLEHQRGMALRQARLKFGGATADRMSPVLDRIADPAVLTQVGAWVIQCRDGAELLARTEAAADSGNGKNGRKRPR